MTFRWLLLTWSLTGLLAGCSAPHDPFAIKIAKHGEGYTFASGNYLAPLDGGRIEIATPDGWTPKPQSSENLARFYLNSVNELPQIEVTAHDSPFEGIEDVTEKNLQKYAKMVAAEIEKDKRSFIEPVKPMIIGGTPCVRYVVPVIIHKPTRQGSRISINAERQIIETVRGGRLYSVDLSVDEGTILRHRDAGYSVVAGMKFHDAGSSPTGDDGEPSGDGGADAGDDDTSPFSGIPKLEDVKNETNNPSK